MIASAAVSKKLEQKQRRRELEEKRRSEARKEALRRNLVTIIVAVVVIAVVVVAIVVQRGSESGIAGEVGVSEAEANCGEIESPEDQGRDHIPDGEPHAPYSSSPPTSGPHYGSPAAVSFYAEQMPPEQLIHNMEHGQIVIWYNPDAPADLIDQVETLVRQEPAATVATAYTDIESPYQMVLSAWGKIQMCEKVSQDVVDDFRRRFQGKSPEPLTEPFEG